MKFWIFFGFIFWAHGRESGWNVEQVIYRYSGETAVFQCHRPSGNTLAGKWFIFFFEKFPKKIRQKVF
mgnify:CR=1 FL=1